jgi:hypothetical protein
MTRLMILMGALVAFLGACGPPDPGLMAEESAERALDDPRGAYDDDVGNIPLGF